MEQVVRLAFIGCGVISTHHLTAIAAAGQEDRDKDGGQHPATRRRATRRGRTPAANRQQTAASRQPPAASRPSAGAPRGVLPGTMRARERCGTT